MDGEDSEVVSDGQTNGPKRSARRSTLATMDSIKTPLSLTAIQTVRPFTKPISTCLLVAGMLSVASTLEALDWRFQLLAHWRPQMAVCLAFGAAVLTAVRQRQAAWVSLGLAMVNLLSATPALQYVQPLVAHASGAESGTYRLASFNVNFGNYEYGRLTEWIEENRPDVVILLEMTPGWRRSLASMSSEYPWQFWTPGKRYGDGIGMFSRYPLEGRTILNPAGGIKMAVTAKLHLPNGTSCRLIGVHPMAPRSYEETRQRDAYLRDLDSIVAMLKEPVTVAGDFNTTPWSYGFRLLTETSGLRGAGLLPTWPSPVTGVGIPIDHVLSAKGASIARLTRGPNLGSDHLPLLAEIVVTAPTSDSPSGRSTFPPR